MWIDSHCHLDAAEFDADRDDVVARARAAGVAMQVIPAVEVANFEAVRRLAHEGGLSYALGIHPLYVDRASNDDLDCLADALQACKDDPRLVAVGEIGLDHFVPGSNRERQERFYAAQCQHAGDAAPLDAGANGGVYQRQRARGFAAPGRAAVSEALQGLAPIARRDARLLVLGSFPGVASLQSQQYYAHARNLFWPILSALWGVDLMSLPYAQRIAQAQRHGLAIWDVYAACRRDGSLDSAIEDAQLNDLASLRCRAPGLQAVAHNGGESARSMRITAALGVPVHKLPSTSPANASWSFERKLAAWRAVFKQVGLP